jgi:predicted RNase H-like HicB family nuclease
MSKKIEIIKTKYGSFSCIFEPEKDMGGYMVVAKGAAGAISWGKDMAEARRMIVESIEVCIEGELIIATREAQDNVLKKYSHSKA